MSAYGTLAAHWDPPALRFLIEGLTTPNSRTGPIVTLLRTVLPEIGRDMGRGLVLVQYDDYVHNDFCSIGFGRRRGEAPAVVLIPDPYFLQSEGYQTLRTKIRNGSLLPWSGRRDVLFWRGSATHGGFTRCGARIERLQEIPRVALCLKLRGVAGTDAAIVAPWQYIPFETAVPWLQAQRIWRPAVSAEEQAQHRYLVDIDGVANAWGFFEKLLMGSCVLKVATPYEQWFYDAIFPWTHYVPVAADMSDLHRQIRWCRQNPAAAEGIAAAGQAYALSFSYEDAMDLIRKALRGCFTCF
jgi:hypothetical protein